MLKGKSVALTTFGMDRTERPVHSDIKVDCRPIKNPYGLRGDAETIMLQSPGFPVVVGLAMENILTALRTHDHVEVGVCCNYGKHRSPMVSSVLRTLLTSLGVAVDDPQHLSAEADNRQKEARHALVLAPPTRASSGGANGAV